MVDNVQNVASMMANLSMAPSTNVFPGPNVGANISTMFSGPVEEDEESDMLSDSDVEEESGENDSDVEEDSEENDSDIDEGDAFGVALEFMNGVPETKVDTSAEDFLIQGLADSIAMRGLLPLINVRGIDLPLLLTSHIDGADPNAIRMLAQAHYFDLTNAAIATPDIDTLKVLLEYPDRINFSIVVAHKRGKDMLAEIFKFKDRINIDDATYWAMIAGNSEAVSYIVENNYISPDVYGEIYGVWEKSPKQTS